LNDDLQEAFAKDQFLLHYQPQVNMAREIVAYEALLRWRSPKRGYVSPMDFIPLAEESGLIAPLGNWVLREACRTAAGWRDNVTIAVNISPEQIAQGDLPTAVHEILLETGLAPSRLELEITEGVFISDFSRALSVLLRLKSLGVQIAMDDFGTGYSSLSYLQAFPFDRIKIDRAFVTDLGTNNRSDSIVRAVISLGQSLDIPLLAEGVETEEQFAKLRELGCHSVQGYLFGRPQPLVEIAGNEGAVGRVSNSRPT